MATTPVYGGVVIASAKGQSKKRKPPKAKERSVYTTIYQTTIYTLTLIMFISILIF